MIDGILDDVVSDIVGDLVGYPVANGLANGIVAYYRLEDESDDLGVRHLTNINGVTFVPGKNQLCANINESGSQALVHANDPVYFGGGTGSFAVDLWFIVNSDPTQGLLVCHDLMPSGYFIGRLGDDYSAICSADSGTVTETAFVTLTGLSGNWVHVYFERDVDLGHIRIRINDTHEHTVPFDSAYDITTISDFTIGGAPAFSIYWNVEIDEIGIWNRVLTPAEITMRYNLVRP